MWRQSNNCFHILSSKIYIIIRARSAALGNYRACRFVVRDGVVYLLATGELELCSPEGLNDMSLVLVVGSDADDWLADVDASNGALGLTERTSHTGLQPAWKHKLVLELQLT